MGYWGTEPKDGDGPMDILDEVTRCVSRNMLEKYEKLDRTPGSAHYPMFLWDMAGVVQILVEGQIPLDPRITDHAVNDLNDFLDLDDDDFVGPWKSPSEVKVSIRKVIKLLDK